MFGRNKMNQEEREKINRIAELDRHFFSEMDGKEKVFEATETELEDSRKQAESEMSQIRENILSASELASGNVEIEAALTRKISEYKETMQQKEEQQKETLEQIHNLYDEIVRLVDDNKHYTSPSKFLSEFPSGIRMGNDSMRQGIEQMEEFDRKMGVLALNAAIEAGRLGDSSRQFVAAAEDIRTFASDYDAVIKSVKEQLKESDEKITQLEEQVHHLVGLLKENNVATARLMKSCGNTLKQADQTLTGSMTESVAEISGQMITLKNADEEIIKSEERNRMQMEDMAEEFNTQKEKQKELIRMVDPLFRHIVERKAD